MPPTIKLAVFGAAGSGKSAAIQKHVNNKFERDYKPTVGGRKKII